MAEPGKVKVETITYQHGNGRQVSVNVRKNRTAAETVAQLNRIYDTYNDINRLNRAFTVHAQTRRALNVTGRDNDIPGMPVSLVSRRNNRR